MTLLIACILIYHFDMGWWWYGVATLAYIGRTVVYLNFMNKKVVPVQIKQWSLSWVRHRSR